MTGTLGRRAMKVERRVGLILVGALLACAANAANVVAGRGGYSLGASLHYGIFYPSGEFLADPGQSAWRSYGIWLHFGTGAENKLRLLIGMSQHSLRWSEELNGLSRESSLSMVPLQVGLRWNLVGKGPLGYYCGGGLGYLSIHETYVCSLQGMDYELVNDESGSAFGWFVLVGVECALGSKLAVNAEAEGSRMEVANGYVPGNGNLRRMVDGIAFNGGLSYYY